GTDVEQGAKRRGRRQGASVRERIRCFERQLGGDLPGQRELAPYGFAQVRAELRVALEKQRRHPCGLIPAEQRIVQGNGQVVIHLQSARVLVRELVAGPAFESPAGGVAHAELGGARAKLEPPALAAEVEEINRSLRAHTIERA